MTVKCIEAAVGGGGGEGVVANHEHSALELNITWLLWIQVSFKEIKFDIDLVAANQISPFLKNLW